MNNNTLTRFVSAQDPDYGEALAEIKAGRKTGHWIWYIFPQMKGLGMSSMSDFYGITSREEAESYLADSTLGPRLREISAVLLKHVGQHTAWEILGATDAMKVRSSMTLFDAICPNDVFSQVLDAFYEGQRCERTLKMI